MTRTRIATAVAIALAAAFIGAVFGQPGSGRAAGTGPANMGTPTISGTAQDGQTLATTKGTWGGSPTSYTYAWSRCDSSGSSCTTIAGATAATYTAAAADKGTTLRVTVTAGNAGGSTPATSAPSAVISDKAAPTDTAAPSISGSLQVGSTLTAGKGTWSGSPTSYALAWSRCDASGNGCAKIDGATGGSYTLGAAGAGRTYRLSVVATNKTGSTQFTSAQTAAVPVSNGCPAGTGAIQIADLNPPARLMIDKASISPHLVTLSTHTIQLHFLVTACSGRPVQGATVFASPIPYNQFAGTEAKTGADGTVTLTEQRQAGFPARGRNQHLLAVFARATKAGEPVLAGVSTRRTVAFQVTLP
jgi:hypothetical protein